MKRPGHGPAAVRRLRPPTVAPPASGAMADVDPATLFAERPKWVASAIALVFLVTVGIADFHTGREVSLSVFYVAPIALTTRFVNRKTGVAFALLSALTWFLADGMGRPHVQPLVPYWNALVRLGFYLVTVVILAKLKTAHEHERGLSREDPTAGIPNPRAFFEWWIHSARAVGAWGHFCGGWGRGLPQSPPQ